MSVESRELALYIINDGRLYEKYSSPACINLSKKMQKKTFDAEKAKILFGHIAEAGAKQYHKEFGCQSQPWHKMFSVSDRKECAAELLEYYMEGIKELAGDVE